MVAAGYSGDELPQRNISGSRSVTTEEKVAAPLCVTYPCVVRLSVSTLLAYMNRWTARVLLLLLLMGTFGPVALAISASAQHACCMRKPMRRSGHENAFQSVSHQHTLGAGRDSSPRPRHASGNRFEFRNAASRSQAAR